MQVCVCECVAKLNVFISPSSMCYQHNIHVCVDYASVIFGGSTTSRRPCQCIGKSLACVWSSVCLCSAMPCCAMYKLFIPIHFSHLILSSSVVRPVHTQ